VLEAEQTVKETYRNDRMIAVHHTCPLFGHYKSVSDMPYELKKQVEHFFESYNAVQGKRFNALGWADAAAAMQLIEKTKTLEKKRSNLIK